MDLAGCARLATVLLLVSGLAEADVLVTANGDRLNGKLVEERDGVLVFESELLGRVEVPAERASIQPGPIAVTVTATAIAASSDVAKTLPPDAAPDTPALRWTSDVGLRLSIDRGSLETPEDDFRVAVKSRRPTRYGVITSGIDYRYKRTDDVLKDNDWDIQIGYEHFLDDRRFVAGRALANRTLTSSDYDETQAGVVSAGWRLWEGEGQHLRIGPALGYLHTRRNQAQLDAPTLGLYATAEGQAWARIRFSSELVVLDTLSDGRYANLELRLRQPLGERLFLALVWDYVWTDFDIEPGVRSEWRWDLGWRFGPDASR